MNNNLLTAVRLGISVGYGILGLLASSILNANQIQAEQLHISQTQLNKILKTKGSSHAFEKAFNVGDELFEHQFLASDGVGANVGNGARFSLVPRADLNAASQWASHTPKRVTGPNAQSCDVCHSTPFGDGAGRVVLNNIRDPLHTGMVSSFINRQAPHIFGIGALQRLAEEMSQALHAIRASALGEAQSTGQPVTRELIAKQVNFGQLTAHPDASLDTSAVFGIDPDLLVKPIEWKGITASIRAFARDAGHNELGMQAVEITGDGVDGDGDGVVDELSVGDITAMVIYQAAQPRPTTRQELAQLGVIPPLSAEELDQIKKGERIFSNTGCNSCHKPQLVINDPIFREPSLNPNYRDKIFPAGQDPLSKGVDPLQPITFDLTRDLPDNIISHQDGTTTHLGNFQSDDKGAAIVRLFGDLKRHDMGPALAESIDEAGTGAATFITKELWGVGSTPPYLHDGRATTLTEAIRFHGGESAQSRDRFNALAQGEKESLITYLKNLVLYKTEEE